MKKIALLTVLCAMVICTFAQTNTFPGTGNVGIGTLSPSSLLHLNGGYTTDCNTYSGQPAIKINWTEPNNSCTIPGPSGTPPNILQVTTPSGPFTVPPNIDQPRFIIDALGKVGINTTPSTADFLTVNGTTNLKGNTTIVGNLTLNKLMDFSTREINANSTLRGLTINVNSHPTNGSSIEMYAKDNADATRKGSIRFISHGNSGEGMVFLNYDPAISTWKCTMTITNDNKVYIGNVKPSGQFANYAFGVDGNIVCKRAVVQITDWADFVFKPDYKLMPLAEVETFVKQNHHLPNIPSKKDVLEKGMDVSEMNKLLLQKIEELTLYMIELKKENQLIKTKLERL